MPLPYNMPFETLLECVAGRTLNLWLHQVTDSYRHAMRYQARHHRRSRAASDSVMAKDRPTPAGLLMMGPPADLPATGAVADLTAAVIFSAKF